MFQYRETVLLDPERYVYDYVKENIRVECELRLIPINTLRVYFTMTKVSNERDSHDRFISEDDISSVMHAIDEFMYLLQEHLVIDEHYDKIVVFSYGHRTLNKIIKEKYNLEYSYDYDHNRDYI